MNEIDQRKEVKFTNEWTDTFSECKKISLPSKHAMNWIRFWFNWSRNVESIAGQYFTQLKWNWNLQISFEGLVFVGNTLTIWEKSSFNIIQEIIIAEDQVNSRGISWRCACSFTSIHNVPYCVRIKIWLFIIKIFYLEKQ